MHVEGPGDASLTIALALAAGMLAQSVARHLRIPGIVLLLAAGLLLGPDFAAVIRTDRLGQTLYALVGFAVAVILFEGGMNLDFQRLRKEGRAIRQLVTLGALVSAVGGTLASHWLLNWPWRPSILFGTLMIVTGPTVVTPLLRRIRLRKNVATVLEAEGVLGDAIGALLAVVALEVALQPSGRALADGLVDLLFRLGFGATVGAVAGFVISRLLRWERVVPEGLENVFTLAMALALFQSSNAFLQESGIVSVTVAGMVVGNVHSRGLADLREFKEQLTVMFIGMLFVLLAADVRIADVRALGMPGLWTVIVLMFVVRPLNVLVGTWGSDLTPRERLFLCWLAPRGIVAAAVASLFAQSLTAAGLPGGAELQAMVFLVIGVTVAVQGLSGGIVAGLLRLRRITNEGFVLLGANDLARAMGRLLRDGGAEVVLIDSSAEACTVAEQEGFRVLFGNGLQDSILYRAELDGREGCIALTSNDEANLLFARKARSEFKVPRVWVALRSGHVSVTSRMVEQAGGRVLFGEPRQVDLWTLRLERGIARVQTWRRTEPGPCEELVHLDRDAALWILPLAVRRGDRVILMDEDLTVREKDLLQVLVLEERREEAQAWLAGHGWEPEESGVPLESPSGSPEIAGEQA